MAQLTGVLAADFSSFEAAVDSSIVKLRSFEGDASKVGTSLSRMADSLSGRKLIQDATLMAEAVEQIGGTSKLTEKELARLGGTAAEAAAKMRALGMEVPANLQEIATHARSATAATMDWKAALLSTAGALGVAFSISAVKNFAVGVIEAGAAIGDLAQKLGISAEAVQRFKYAAEQSGASIETVDRAIKAMNVNLAEGSKSTRGALESVGLSFDEIRQMKPEAAFIAIADATAEIEDPMIRAKVATELFGKAGQELLPAFLDGIRKVGAETRVMSDETVARLKAAEDAWGRLSNYVTIVTGEWIANVAKMHSSWSAFAVSLAPDWLRPALEQYTGVTESFTAALKTVPPAAQAVVSQGLQPIAAATAEAATATAELTERQADFRTTVIGMEVPTADLSHWTRMQVKYTEILNEQLRFTSEVIGQAVIPELEQLTTKIEAVTVAQNELTAVSKNAPGSVGVTLGGGGGIRLNTDLQSAVAQYNQRYGLGGSSQPDFLAWALSSGLATKTAPTVNNTFNIVDTESGIARRVGETVTRTIQQGSLV